MDVPKNSAAKIKANAKYTAKTYDQFLVYVSKGRKSDLREHAESQGESLNGFVNRAIDNQIKNDMED